MVLLAESGLSSLLVTVAMITVISILLMRSRRYFARQGSNRSPIVKAARPRSTVSGTRPTTPDDLARWEVRMHEIDRDTSAQLDSKMSALEHLIREADRAAARLERALESSPRPSGPTLPASQADRLKSSGAAKATAESQPDRAARISDPEPAADQDRRYEEIYTLSDYGFNSSDIANRVGTPVGEVELILGLRKNL